jgi:hypothetical protein
LIEFKKLSASNHWNQQGRHLTPEPEIARSSHASPTTAVNRREISYMKFRKKLMIWVIAGAIVYFVLSYHFIFVENTVKILKKSSLTLDYTLFSTKGKTNESILSIDQLREDGIGDLLVEAGRLTEEELERLLNKMEE